MVSPGYSIEIRPRIEIIVLYSGAQFPAITVSFCGEIQICDSEGIAEIEPKKSLQNAIIFFLLETCFVTGAVGKLLIFPIWCCCGISI